MAYTVQGEITTIMTEHDSNSRTGKRSRNTETQVLLSTPTQPLKTAGSHDTLTERLTSTDAKMLTHAFLTHHRSSIGSSTDGQMFKPSSHAEMWTEWDLRTDLRTTGLCTGTRNHAKPRTNVSSLQINQSEPKPYPSSLTAGLKYCRSQADYITAL